MTQSSIATLGILSILWLLNPVMAAGVIDPYQNEGNALSFTLKDLDNTPHKLEDYRGKVVLVNFWASWCSPCIREMPGMQRLSDIMEGRPFEIVAISVSERRKTVQHMLQRLDLDFTVLLDPDGKTFNEWRASMLPTSYLIDTTGRIHYKAQGPMEWDEEDLVSIVEKLMPGQP